MLHTNKPAPRRDVPVMRVLVACEFSGRVRDAFIAAGHDAISADLLPTETASDVDEIQGELQSLIGMMEPYYAQGNCYKDAQALIDKLEDMLCAPHSPTDGG